MHILVRNVHRKVRELFIPHCKSLSSLVYKRMELEEDDFAHLFVEAVREFGRVTTRREVAQQAVETVGRFNGDKVPSYMEAYNEDMHI